jgi:hypothetical protein
VTCIPTALAGGAPDAVQVIDRFHQARNFREAVEALLINQQLALQAAAVGAAKMLRPPGRAAITPMHGGDVRGLRPWCCS